MTAREKEDIFGKYDCNCARMEEGWSAYRLASAVLVCHNLGCAILLLHRGTPAPRNELKSLSRIFSATRNDRIAGLVPSVMLANACVRGLALARNIRRCRLSPLALLSHSYHCSRSSCRKKLIQQIRITNSRQNGWLQMEKHAHKFKVSSTRSNFEPTSSRFHDATSHVHGQG